jgi:hypothetical protein
MRTFRGLLDEGDHPRLIVARQSRPGFFNIERIGKVVKHVKVNDEVRSSDLDDLQNIGHRIRELPYKKKSVKEELDLLAEDLDEAKIWSIDLHGRRMMAHHRMARWHDKQIDKANDPDTQSAHWEAAKAHSAAAAHHQRLSFEYNPKYHTHDIGPIAQKAAHAASTNALKLSRKAVKPLGEHEEVDLHEETLDDALALTEGKYHHKDWIFGGAKPSPSDRRYHNYQYHNKRTGKGATLIHQHGEKASTILADKNSFDDLGTKRKRNPESRDTRGFDHYRKAHEFLTRQGFKRKLASDVKEEVELMEKAERAEQKFKVGDLVSVGDSEFHTVTKVNHPMVHTDISEKRGNGDNGYHWTKVYKF